MFGLLRTMARRAPRLAALTIATTLAVSAQDLMPASEGVVLPLHSDTAILEADESRKDLPCLVNPAKPVLGFDMKFHTGYDVTVPLKELSGDGNLLTMVFKVTPEAVPDSPVYLLQRFDVPEIEEEAKGDAYLQGFFDVGEGKYHVSWLLRDRTERICSSNWSIDAGLPGRDRQMPLDIAANAVQAANRELFRPEPPVNRNPHDAPLNVKVLVNFAPQVSTAATLQPIDTDALLSILRNVVREPRVGKITVIAFNMQEQRVIYRQGGAPEIDFPGLGSALKSLALGTVSFSQLVDKNGDTEFLANLIKGELNEGEGQPDAVIIAGPKVMLEDGVPRDVLSKIEVGYPVFYLNYALDPNAFPWRDTIGSAVRSLKGSEFTISRPRDLYFAWTEILDRIVKLKVGRTMAGSSPAQ